ncbi:hypothetical protein [Marinoscillum sp.]|uniref:hypothetical protein n=1 Tax=Marinoscillum sp. TaxID=2024838 RepID=UPI003BA9CF6C
MLSHQRAEVADSIGRPESPEASGLSRIQELNRPHSGLLEWVGSLFLEEELLIFESVTN